jgi:hypothetical protein
MDLLLPDVRVAKISPQLMDNTGRFSSPLSGTVRSVARPGDRWSFQLDYQNLQGLDRARLESFIANMRGAANRALYSPGDYIQRGSFPSAELLANNAFKNGVTGWSATASTIAVTDRALRVAPTFPQGTLPTAVSTISSVAYTPYVGRALFGSGRGMPSGNGAGVQLLGSSAISSAFSTAPGMQSTVLTADGTTLNLSMIANAGVDSGATFGNFLDFYYASLTQCALVDNSPNLLTFSDQQNNAAWTKLRTSIAGGGGTVAAPDGTTTASILAEDTTATSTHLIEQNVTIPASVADYCFSVVVAANSRTWCEIILQENTAFGSISIYVNLATGAFGSSATTSNWSNLRAFIAPLGATVGSGWYKVDLIGRKTNAATSLTGLILLATGNGVNTYTGTSQSMLIWRCGIAQSSVPLSPSQTAGSITAGISQTGNALRIKGLPVSANGLLLAGDWIEVNKELKRVTGALNSDASGLGYLQFSPPLRNSPNDNDPVIVNNPMGRFTLKNPSNGWASTPLYFASSSLVLEEAP